MMKKMGRTVNNIRTVYIGVDDKKFKTENVKISDVKVLEIKNSIEKIKENL